MKKLLSFILGFAFSLGSLLAQEPTTPSSNGKVGTLTCTSAQLSWTSGNGTWRMGLLIEGSGSANTPADGTKYTAVAAFGSGTNMGTNSFVVFDNITNSVNITNLKKNTSYEFRLYEHNGGATPDYLTSSYLTIKFSTQNLVLGFDFSYSDSCQNTNYVKFTNTSTATYSGIKYTWLFQDGNTDTGKNVNHTYTKGGSFLVTLLASPALGCTDNYTQTKSVFIIPRPVSIPIEKNNDTAQCFVGHQFKFDDQTQLAKVPKTAYIRTWYFGPGDSATIPTPTRTYPAPGKYRIIYKSETLYDNKRTGCTDTTSMYVRVIPDPSSGISINDSIQCFKSNSFVFDNVFPGLSSFSWDLGDGTTSTVKKVTRSYAAVGIYPVIHAAASPEGCSSIDTVFVVVKRNVDPSFSGLPATLCLGDPAITLTPAETTNGVFYGNTFNGFDFSPTVAGLQKIKYVIKDTFCPDSSTQNITISPLPKFSLGKDSSVCDGKSMTLYAGATGTVTWDDASVGSSRSVNKGGTYWAEVNNNGCKWRDSILIYEGTSPQVKLPEDTLICQGAMLQLKASWPGAKVQWNNGSTDSVIYVSTSGFYQATLTNPCGSASDGVQVTIKSGLCDAFIPTAFTPNGDGRNETFTITGRGVNPTYFIIFNRWGEKVFDSNDNGSFEWDGNSKGEPCMEGFYQFLFRYDIITGDLKRHNTIKGNVYLMR